MSLRRKSCNACFKGRRKCNLAHPVCDNCRRTNKICRYAYPPSPAGPTSERPVAPDQTSASLTAQRSVTTADLEFEFLEPSVMMMTDLSACDSQLQHSLGSSPSQGLPRATAGFSPESISFSATSKLVGTLGEVQPLQGSTRSWQWVMDELKVYPREFAQQGETVFMHRDLYRGEMPQPIRTAFGACSCLCLNIKSNREMAFRVIDAEVLELLKPTEPSSSPDTKPAADLKELARLQALLLYQTIRLFQGSLQQRITAEQQGSTLMTMALKLVVRAQSQPELRTPKTRQDWILGECIRRTALLVYFLYGVNSVYREGICVGLHTLRQLPLSTEISSWDEDGECEVREDQRHSRWEAIETFPYEAFLGRWLVSMPRRLDRFEKLLIVPCQGLEAAEAFEELGLLVA